MCRAIQKCIYGGKKAKYQNDSWYALSGTLSYMGGDSIPPTEVGLVLNRPAK